MIYSRTYSTDQFYNKAMGKLRWLARDRATKALRNPNEPAIKRKKLPITDLQFLARFTTETAFYIEELERITEEEMNDYWETREHALHILTEHMIDHLNSDSSEKKD